MKTIEEIILELMQYKTSLADQRVDFVARGQMILADITGEKIRTVEDCMRLVEGGPDKLNLKNEVS